MDSEMPMLEGPGGTTLALAVAAARAHRKLTQRQLADAVGYSNERTISAIERGRRVPTIAALERISQALLVEFTLNPAGWRWTSKRKMGRRR